MHAILSTSHNQHPWLDLPLIHLINTLNHKLQEISKISTRSQWSTLTWLNLPYLLLINLINTLAHKLQEIFNISIRSQWSSLTNSQKKNELDVYKIQQVCNKCYKCSNYNYNTLYLLWYLVFFSCTRRGMKVISWLDERMTLKQTKTL